ncbi:MAG: invasion associated locus B family protein [Candidatus Fonsibacter ubiquis]
MSLRVLLFSIICLLSFEQKIFAQIKLDGQFKNWTAQNTNINGQQVCYAVSSPIASDPKTLNRAESRIFVSFRANDKIQNEISVTSGYNYKASSKVNLAIEKREFNFETEDNFAWLTKYEDEISLIELMRKSSQVKVSATSVRGTKTIDTFSLSGFSDAYEAAKKKCNFSS